MYHVLCVLSYHGDLGLSLTSVVSWFYVQSFLHWFSVSLHCLISINQWSVVEVQADNYNIVRIVSLMWFIKLFILLVCYSIYVWVNTALWCCKPLEASETVLKGHLVVVPWVCLDQVDSFKSLWSLHSCGKISGGLNEGTLIFWRRYPTFFCLH